MMLFDYLNELSNAKHIPLDKMLITVFDNHAIESKAILYKGVADWCWCDCKVSYAKQIQSDGILPEFHIWAD